MILRNHFQPHIGGHFIKTFDSWPGASGETLIEEYELTLGDIKVDLTSTGMMFDSDATPTDFSIYAGNDTDSTPYRMVLVDDADKEANFFVGAGGLGEALGAELITEWVNWTPAYETFTASGTDISSAISTTLDGYAKTNTFNVAGAKICRLDTTITLNSGAYPGCGLLNSAGYTQVIPLSDSNTRYFTDYPGGTLGTSLFYIYSKAAANFSAATSGKILTDVPATGIHCITELNGSTRGFTSIDVGFNPNAITKVRVYEL